MASLRHSARVGVWLVLLGAAQALGGNLLAGRAPQRSQGVASPERLTDGQVAFDGDGWTSPAAAELPPEASVQWDLGALRELRAAAVQGDNNDDYVLSGSIDGEAWTELWRSGGVGQPGLQRRSTQSLQAQARYLKLTATGGDGRYSASELEVFDGEGTAGSKLLKPFWTPEHPLERGWTYWLAFVALLLFGTSAGAPRLQRIVYGLVAAFGFFVLARNTFPAGVDAARLNYIRAVVAAMAALAVAREALWPKRWPADRPTVFAVLGLSAALGVLCFLNLGHPQFFDVGQRRPTFLHHYDMRTYFPIARDFPRLRFDGVYAASAAAVGEDRGGLQAIGAVEYRDLRTHAMTTVAASTAHIAEVRARFSPEQWQRARADLAYFRGAMGDGAFLDSMHDHGGNATPVWFLGARALMGGFAASDFSLWLGVAADIALMLLAFAGFAWAFGPRTALVAMTLFGAMDFYMFGTNWFGAALRHDWLALWALGLAALKKERFALGGALLAWSALIRAFPALAFVTVTAPAVFATLAQLRAQGRAFSFAQWRRENRPLLQVAQGAVLFGGALFVLSALVFGFDAWTEWLRKVSLLNADGHVNNLAVRTWVTNAKGPWAGLVALSLVLVFTAARRASWHEAASYGVVLLPVVFNPANYYLHSVFLLAALGGEAKGEPSRAGTLVWLALLLMCVGSFFTSLTSDLGTHFRLDTGVLLTALGAVMAVKLFASLESSPASVQTEAAARG